MRRGLELAISTFILLVIAIFVLIGLIFAVKRGFSDFDDNSKPLIESSEIGGIRAACNVACSSGDDYGFCCKNYSLGMESVKCDDKRLSVECSIACSGVKC